MSENEKIGLILQPSLAMTTPDHNKFYELEAWCIEDKLEPRILTPHCFLDKCIEMLRREPTLGLGALQKEGDTFIEKNASRISAIYYDLMLGQYPDLGEIIITGLQHHNLQTGDKEVRQDRQVRYLLTYGV
ncbi:hypothetical protein J4209_00385 [Candidatus Woesearchaeota archaeon]|nr:hypothetical protein [Candidatus Woesearchaeota archaeon]